MRPLKFTILIAAVSFGTAPTAAQDRYPYVITTVAGSFPLGDGGPATSALLSFPSKSVGDANGNIYIVDGGNSRIRKVVPDGTISTLMMANVYRDIALSANGDIYFIGVDRAIYKAPPGGTPIRIAGTSHVFGFSGDGGPAVNAQLGDVEFLALDPNGTLYFIDGSRVREVTTDGNIHTIAGGATNGNTGDGGPAVNALLQGPKGIAVDSAHNLYIGTSCAIRKVGPDGIISVFAGSAIQCGSPVNGPKTASPLGAVIALVIDGQNNIYEAEADSIICKISPAGQLVVIAGDGRQYGPFADGPALETEFENVTGLGTDSVGNLLVTDLGTQKVRRISGGNIVTIAGRSHDDGDGGPATQAVLYGPEDVALDASGNLFISDTFNQKIRKVAPDGTISTYAGTGVPGFIATGSIPNVSVTGSSNIAVDASGAVYFVNAGIQVQKISPQGVVSSVAGMRASGDSGDGGPATKATFSAIAGMAIDAQGNIFVADAATNRVRKISAATGVVTAWAGDGKGGPVVDGIPATTAHLNFISYIPAPLAVDHGGNLYIADSLNYRIRKVTPSGIISTVAGNGTFTIVDGQPALSTAMPLIGGLGFDNSDNLYFSSLSTNDIWGIINGVVRRLSGTDQDDPTTSTAGFIGAGLTVDANSDIYVADPDGPFIEKLVLNAPSGLVIVDGNHQAGLVGTTLSNPLRVQVNGRAGVPVPGATVYFLVTSGSASVAYSTQTDSSGIASVAVTLGMSPGDITITATSSNSSVPPVQFNLAARAVGDPCLIGPPAITSATSLSGFGGSSAFASGSWLQVKGANLAIESRLWADSDFTSSNAPTALNGTTVSINGLPAFVEYISSSQINVQAPDDPFTGAVPITVTNCAGSSAPITVSKATTAPGMLAPDSFNVGGKQYMVALFPDGTTYVGISGLVSGTAFRPARPDDTIVAYGIGFGNVTPNTPAGVIAQQSATMTGLQIMFGTAPAVVTYAGLSVGAVGLYQFNITVPDVPEGDNNVRITINGVPAQSNLFLTIQR